MCNTQEQLADVCSTYYSTLCDCGFTKPSCAVQLKDRSSIVQSLCMQELLSSKAEMDQLQEGLRSAKVLDVLLKYPEILQNFFVRTKQKKLTSGNIYKFFFFGCFCLLFIL